MPEQPTRRPVPRWALPAVLVGAVAVRLWAWSWAMQMTNDGVDFLWQAQRLLAGEIQLMLSHPYHPLTGVAIAGLSFVTGSVLSAAAAVSVLSGALIVLAAHDLARMAFPDLRWAGFWAAVLAAVHSRTLIYTSDVQSDGLFLALFLLALRMAFASAETGVCRRRMAAAGLFTGLAYLTRPEGLFVVLPVGLWALDAWRRSAPSRARVASGVAVFGLVLCVVALPYVLFVHRASGHWGISMKPSVSAIGLSDTLGTTRAPSESPIGSPTVHPAPAAPAGAEAPPPTPAAQPKQGGLLPLPWARQGEASGMSAFVAKSLGIFVHTLREDALVLAAIGLVLLWRRRRGLAVLLLATIGAWILLGAYHLERNSYLSARHVMESVVLMLPLGGAGLAAAWGAARGRARLLFALRALVLLSLFAMLWSGVRPRHEDRGPRLEALQWIRTRTAENERIGVHRRKDSWYAQRPVLIVPTPCDEDDLLSKLRRYQVHYLVFDMEHITRDMPELLENETMHEIKRFGEPGADGEVIVLECVPAEG